MKIDRSKIAAAASKAPAQLDTRVKHHMLRHLYDYANPRRRPVLGLTYKQLFDGTAEGLCIRPHNLRKFLAKVAKAPRSEQADAFSNGLWAMIDNSERSERQRRNTAA